MPFGQLVIGPPGSGKTTFCNGMQQFLSAIGRKCSVINLDPANEQITYPCAVDIRSLISLDTIMREEELGPNGAMLYALEALEHNFEWLESALKNLGDDYAIFDCPGQVELFTHHDSLKNILLRVQKLGYRLVALHLVDSFCLSQPSLYISTLLLSLRTMLQIDLPHLNVLTKIDKLTTYGPLPFSLDFYTEVHDLSYLDPYLAAENPMMRDSRFKGLNDAVRELIEEYGLVGFETLAVEDKKSMMTLLQAIDRTGGYAFGGAEGANDTVWQVAMREGLPGLTVQDVQERWIDRKDEFDEAERLQAEAEAEAASDATQPAWPQSDGLNNGRIDPMRKLDDPMEDDEAYRGQLPDSGIKVIRKTI